MKAAKPKNISEAIFDVPHNIKDTISNALHHLMGFQKHEQKPKNNPKEEIKIVSSENEPLIQEVPYVFDHSKQEERTQSTLLDEEIKEEKVHETQPNFMIDTSSKQRSKKHF